MRGLTRIPPQPELNIECDAISAALRGDPEPRLKACDIAIRNGILSAEECRAVEGWNRRAPAERPAPQSQEAPG